MMLPLTLKLKQRELYAIKGFLKYEEPRVIRRANILNCYIMGIHQAKYR